MMDINLQKHSGKNTLRKQKTSTESLNIVDATHLDISEEIARSVSRWSDTEILSSMLVSEKQDDEMFYLVLLSEMVFRGQIR
jgi:hypothetical protein